MKTAVPNPQAENDRKSLKGLVSRDLIRLTVCNGVWWSLFSVMKQLSLITVSLVVGSWTKSNHTTVKRFNYGAKGGRAPAFIAFYKYFYEIVWKVAHLFAPNDQHFSKIQGIRIPPARVDYFIKFGECGASRCASILKLSLHVDKLF